MVWVRSSLLALRREQVRREHLARATQDLEALAARLARPRSRLRARHEIMDHVQKVLTKYHVRGYLTVQLAQAEEHRFHQAGPGRLMYRPTRTWYPGARPSKKAMEQVRKRVSEIFWRGLTERWKDICRELNRYLTGWARYFAYDTAYPRSVGWTSTWRTGRGIS